MGHSPPRVSRQTLADVSDLQASAHLSDLPSRTRTRTRRGARRWAILEPPKLAQHLPDMPGRQKLRREDVANNPLAIDEISNPAGENPERSRDAVTGPNLPAGIAQQVKREPPPPREPLMRALRVRADADHLSARLSKRLVAVAERTSLQRARRRVVPRIEKQHHGGLAPKVGKPHGPAIHRRQLKIRRLVSHADWLAIVHVRPRFNGSSLELAMLYSGRPWPAPQDAIREKPPKKSLRSLTGTTIIAIEIQSQ